MVEAIIDNAASRLYDYFARLQESEPELLFVPRIPGADEICQSRVDTRHGDTQENAHSDHLAPCLNERRTQSDQSEAEGDGSKPDARTDKAHCNRGWQLEYNARDGEYKDADRVTISEELQVIEHGRNRC